MSFKEGKLTRPYSSKDTKVIFCWSKYEFYGRTYILLGLQVKQKKDGIFISQDKYVAEILKNFVFIEVKTASTPMETLKPLLKDEDGEEADVHMYRLIIGSLMYLISSRPDIMFVVCACARYQVNPKVLNLHVVKRFFRYLKGQPKLGLWYPKDSPFDLVAYIDSDYVGASLDRKSTTGGCQFLECRLISWQCKKQTMVANSTTKAEYVDASSCWDKCFGFRINYLIMDEAIYKELDDSLVRAATTASSLEAEKDSGAKKPWGIQLLKLELCTNLQQRVLDLETTETTQANEIASLKRRVKKLKKKDRSRTHKLKRLYKVGLSARVESSGDEEDLGEDVSKQERRIHDSYNDFNNDIDADEDITLVNDDNEIFDVDALVGEEVFVAEQSGNVVEEVVAVIDAASTIPVSAAIITDVEITLAQALAELKSAKPKDDKVVIQEPKQGTTTTTPTTIIPVPKPPQDKGKGIMIEEPVVEQVKPMKRLDKELAFKLQAKEEEEERLAREKAQQIEEANIAWDDV
ncbi:hypothetical protein Tco_1010154 [Tanacetum coccineum]